MRNEILSYNRMCQNEGLRLQKGMTFRLFPKPGIFLMSVRKNAPYPDRYLENSHSIIYQGHDAPGEMGPFCDQPLMTKTGQLAENGKFYRQTMAYLRGISPVQKIHLYQKLLPGIWCFNGKYSICDAWEEFVDDRRVFCFQLEPESKNEPAIKTGGKNRNIPSRVKAYVYKRDQGRCAICHSQNNLHFDHIIPVSKGGSSVTSKNIQLLCADHNLAKSDRIA